jgi:nitrate/nitrite transporter NarK
VTGLFFVGIGGGSFAVYWTWISEQYRTECRGSALAFATSIGRFIAAGATFLVGIGIDQYGSLGVPVALTAIPFCAGLVAAAARDRDAWQAVSRL